MQGWEDKPTNIKNINEYEQIQQQIQQLISTANTWFCYCENAGLRGHTKGTASPALKGSIVCCTEEKIKSVIQSNI